MTSSTTDTTPGHGGGSDPSTTATGLSRPGRGVPSGVFAALAVLAVAVNLRAPITSVPPLIPSLEARLGLSGVTAGLITTLPVLCMGVLAPLGQRMGHRLGRERSIMIALAVMLAGTVLRVTGGDGAATLPVLYAGTLLVGAGIAITGSLVPSVVKDRFGARSGLITGTYMGGMCLSAGVGAALAVPLAVAFDSWQLSIAVWAVPVVIAMVVWRPMVRPAPAPVVTATPRARLPWRHPTAWLVTGYLVLQSTQFYTHATWIPATYEDRGWSAASAGALLTAFAAVQGISGVLVPALSDRIRDTRWLLAPCAAATAAGVIGVRFAPDLAPWLWMGLIGAGLGAGFGLGLVYLVSYASDGAASSRLTALAFLFSYGVASLGPVWFGALRDATGGFEVPWTALLVIAIVQVLYAVPMSPRRPKVT